MMDNSEKHTALSWFVAGYVAGHPDNESGYNVLRSSIEDGKESAREALEAYWESRCLACRREGIVLLDGLFCERCHPAIGELIENG